MDALFGVSCFTLYMPNQLVLLREIALAAQVTPPIATHFPVAWSVCHIRDPLLSVQLI